jgi:phosphoglycolate phosphatase-like HAD superfamily hydrolase
MVSRAHADILLAKEAQLAKAIGVTHSLKDAAHLDDAGADHIIEDIPSVLDVLE